MRELDHDDEAWLQSRLEAVAATRDRAAFADLFASVAPRFKAFATRAGLGEFDADRLVEDAMLRIWELAATYDPNLSSFWTWCFCIYRDVRAALHPVEPTPVPQVASWPFGAMSSMADGMLGAGERAASALDLSTDDRILLEKMLVEGKSFEQLAEELTLSAGDIVSRLRDLSVRLSSARPEEGG